MLNYKKLLLFTMLITSVFGQELEKISLQLLWKHQFEFAGFYMAKEKGFYQEIGLDVELKEFNFGTNITQEVMEGKSTFGIGYPNIILDKANGSDILLLGAIFQSSPHVLITLKSSNIKTIEDFKNKRIMIENDSILTVPLLSMLYSKNVKLEDMQLLNPSFDIHDLIDHKTDIFTAYASNELYVLEKNKIPYNIWSPKDYGFDFYNDILFTSNQYYTQSPQTVENFRNASLRGWQYALENINETIGVILDKYNTQNKSADALQFEASVLTQIIQTKNTPIGTLESSKIQRIIDIYTLMGLMKSKIDMDNFLYQDQKSQQLTKKHKKYLEKKSEITMCIDPSWMPFESFENGQHIGMTADYFEVIKQQFNLPITVVPTKTWAESMEYAKNRKCDILSLAMETPSRKKYLNFTTPYLKIPLVLATNHDVTFISDFRTLKDEKIGIPKGYAFVELLKTKYPNINIIEVENIQDGLQKVKEKKLFGYIGTLSSVGYMFQTQFTGDLKIAGKFDETWELGIAVRDDDPILLEILEMSIKNISTDTHREILNKWIAIKYEQKINYTFLWQTLGIVGVFLIFFIYRQILLKKTNKDLQKAVDEKTKELLELNKNLEVKIQNAIADNIEKDKILFTQSKMASMGEMIANISHQWRQPLSIISTVASGMKMKLEYNLFKKEDEMKNLDTLVEYTQYLSKTIDDFQNFLNPTKTLKEFNIQNVIDKVIQMFGQNFKNHNIEIINHCEKHMVVGNENELIQVIINILNNAKDALKAKSFENEEQRMIFIDLKREENQIVLNIKDNAKGIPKEVLPNIFDAYFTTKHKSMGTGIGLYMSYQIIKNSFQGELIASNTDFTYKNHHYQGAKFTIIFPKNNTSP